MTTTGPFIILHDAGHSYPHTGLPFTFWQAGNGFVFRPAKATRYASLEAATAQINKLRQGDPEPRYEWRPESLRPVNPAAGRGMYPAVQP